MALTFGSRLREWREGRHISLAAIADRTKINISLLEGLERDDVSRWPGGIFRRSYFRSYAQAIGLDADAMLRQFLELYPEPDEEVTAAIAKARLGETGKPPTRLRCLIDSAVSALPALALQPSLRLRAEADRSAAPARSDHQPGPATGDRSDLFPSVPTANAPVHDPDPDPPIVADELPSVDFAAVAQLCTRLACAPDVRAVTSVLEGAAKLLDAVGLIVWVRDALAIGLTPVIAHGYPDEMVARLPLVSRDADNAIALSFRTAETRIVEGTETATGAIVAPILTHAGCAGVLAIELRQGHEQRDDVRVAAAFLAAQLSPLLPTPVLADVVGA